MELNIDTKDGGQFSFGREIMYEWCKERYFDHSRFYRPDDLKIYSEFSLRFLPIEDRYHNSFVEIYADNAHFDDCTDSKIYSLIFQTKPVTIYEYENNETVSFFEIESVRKHKIIISCDSVDDRPYWFFNEELKYVKNIFAEPLRIKENFKV